MDTEERAMEETLWDYIDGTLLPHGRTHVEQLIALDAAWRAKYAELLEVHTLMNKSLTIDEPSLRFTQNVMEEISRQYITPAASRYINRNVIRGIGIFFITTIVALLVYGFGQTNWAAAGSYPGADKVESLATFNWSKLYNNSYTNIILIVNIVLGLMLLDMYLVDKRKSAVKASRH